MILIMKAVFPKNIKKGLLAGLTFSIGPLTISIIQLFILAIWVALALVVFSQFQESSKVIGTFFAIIIFLIFAVIAFFDISELNIVAFIAKIIQNHFFDATEKFQTMNEKPNKTEITIKKNKTDDKKEKIDFKTDIKLDNIDDLDKSWIL